MKLFNLFLIFLRKNIHICLRNQVNTMYPFIYIEKIIPSIPSFKQLNLKGLQPIFDC